MIIKASLNNIRANKVRVGDLIELKTRDRSSKKTKEFLVRVVKIVSDIPRCNGCTIRLDNKQSYKYQAGVYCFDCYDRRRKKSIK